ncbi:hypothetical protein MKX01_038165, partial [Papaver californicum]
MITNFWIDFSTQKKIIMKTCTHPEITSSDPHPSIHIVNIDKTTLNRIRQPWKTCLIGK